MGDYEELYNNVVNAYMDAKISLNMGLINTACNMMEDVVLGLDALKILSKTPNQVIFVNMLLAEFDEYKHAVESLADFKGNSLKEVIETNSIMIRELAQKEKIIDDILKEHDDETKKAISPS